MKINHMREFLLLAANKNYTKTAEQLYMAQSVLSRHISAIEEEMGVRLIKRSSTFFELTDAGKIAVDGFKAIVTQYQRTLNEIGRLADLTSGELRVGILYYDVNDYVSVIRRTFRQYFPDVKLDLHSYQPEQQEQALINGEIDAALIYDADASPGSGFRYFPFLKTYYRVICSPNHALAKKDEVLVEDLCGTDILCPSTPLRICQSLNRVNQIFQENDMSPGRMILTSNFDEAPFILEETGAVFISPMVNAEIYPGTVNRLLEPDRYSSKISAVWKSDCDNTLINTLISVLKIAYP